MTKLDRRRIGASLSTKSRELLGSAVRLGVVLCVALAGLTAAARLDDTIAVFDFGADANSAQTFDERTYPASPWVAGANAVIEDARLWMPEDATYRVVHGPMLTRTQYSGFGRHFLLGFLLPRRQIASESARWAFCYGCEPTTLGPRFEVLSDSGDGFLFGRVRP
jgi:hypothetical protein